MRLVPEIVANHLQFQFNRRSPGTDELLYVVQGSPDLSNWTTLSGTEISVTPSATLPGFENVVFQATQGVLNGAPLFVRLSAQLP